MRIVLVGKTVKSISAANTYLTKNHRFKGWGLDDPLDEFIKKIYYFHNFAKIRWEQRLRFYDALYKVDPDIWVKYLSGRLAKSDSNIVVQNARYISEVKYLQNLGFTVVRIVTNNPRGNMGHTVLDAAPGTVVLNEYFNSSTSGGYRVDYSVQGDTKNGIEMGLDSVVEKLKNLPSIKYNNSSP